MGKAWRGSMKYWVESEMTVVLERTNDSDQARTGAIVFASERGNTLIIEPCWVPSMETGFVRFKVHRGTFEWEETYDYIRFEEMVAEVIEKRKLAAK